MSIKILIADDHPLIAEGIKNSISTDKNIEVLAIVSNGKEVLEFIKKKEVDLILLDIDMPEMNGIDCAKEILSKKKETKIAMLSMHQQASIIKELIDAGVKGYMLKTIPSKELLLAINIIYKGESYFNADVTKALLSNENSSRNLLQFKTKSPLVNDLSKREKEIIRHLTEGFTNSQIGEKLFISPRTVDTHRTNIMRKLEIHNVASLIRFAFQNGLES